MKNKLFTPETLKDEYHAAFEKSIKHLYLIKEFEDKIRNTRQTHPRVYMELAVLAHDYGDYAMSLGIRIFDELTDTKPKSPYVIPVQTSFMLTFRCTDCGKDYGTTVTVNGISSDWETLSKYAPASCDCGNEKYNLLTAQKIK